MKKINVRNSGELNEIFAIRCFLNGKRRKTHELTKREARIFRHTARHLSKYLTKEYKLGK